LGKSNEDAVAFITVGATGFDVATGAGMVGAGVVAKNKAPASGGGVLSRDVPTVDMRSKNTEVVREGRVSTSTDPSVAELARSHPPAIAGDCGDLAKKNLELYPGSTLQSTLPEREPHWAVLLANGKTVVDPTLRANLKKWNDKYGNVKYDDVGLNETVFTVERWTELKLRIPVLQNTERQGLQERDPFGR
jgi:hypothetical protein